MKYLLAESNLTEGCVFLTLNGYNTLAWVNGKICGNHSWNWKLSDTPV